MLHLAIKIVDHIQLILAFMFRLYFLYNHKAMNDSSFESFWAVKNLYIVCSGLSIYDCFSGSISYRDQSRVNQIIKTLLIQYTNAYIWNLERW